MALRSDHCGEGPAGVGARKPREFRPRARALVAAPRDRAGDRAVLVIAIFAPGGRGAERRALTTVAIAIRSPAAVHLSSSSNTSLIAPPWSSIVSNEGVRATATVKATSVMIEREPD